MEDLLKDMSEYIPELNVDIKDVTFFFNTENIRIDKSRWIGRRLWIKLFHQMQTVCLFFLFLFLFLFYFVCFFCFILFCFFVYFLLFYFCFFFAFFVLFISFYLLVDLITNFYV